MQNKKLFMASFVIMIIALICMGINRFVSPFPDMAVRVTGIILLINLPVFTYSSVKLKNNGN